MWLNQMKGYKRFGMKLEVLLLLVLLIHHHNCVEVHFEAADSGFFLKHARQAPLAPEIQSYVDTVPPTKQRTAYDSILSVDRFTVVQTTQPVSIRASYGPFSTKQTVPARYIVPDVVDSQGENSLNNTTAALMELQQSNLHLDISAHLVRPTIQRDSPVLRVLFHAGADPGGHLQRQKICVLLHVSMGLQTPLKGRCMPEGEDGVCVAEVVVPSNWWPALPPPQKGSIGTLKVPQRYAQVSYSVFEPPLRNPEQCEPKVQIQPLTTFAQVPLMPITTPFKELRVDDLLTVLIPQHPLYPLSKLHVSVFLHQPIEQKITAFTMKARVKSGVRILGATVISDLWNISIEKENLKHTTARVIAFRKEPQDVSDEVKKDSADLNEKNVFEVFSWLLEVVDDTKEGSASAKIVWSVTYVFDTVKMKDSSSDNLPIDETKKRLIAKLEINKDDIQAVLPMAKNWELMNTAVLTGRQVAHAMKVFIVSQAGKVADVTLQSSCHAEDESVIKVSSSCSSVYVDGSEIRGSSNASVIVKYGTYIGLAKFIVWMPEFPLEVYISDFRLSQIKGWKVVDDNQYLKQNRRRKKRSYSWDQHISSYYNNVGPDKLACRARYQQSPVEIYARFLAIDQNSGRISYFISRRTGLRVTDLVQPLLRVADPKIATLKGRILQGKSMGRTDVQVLSPITGRVIGAKEVRVGSDKVSLSKLVVRVVSGLQLAITPDNTIENGYIAETSVTHKLTAQYQEGLLDIDLEFSDGSKTPLRDISVDDYFLLVESLDTEVVAFAPMLASHHPRVIAVGEGNGDLLKVNLLLSEDCRNRKNSANPKQIKSNIVPLASALASIEVDFNNAENGQKHESVQNDGIVRRDRKGYRSNGDLADIIVGIPLRDASNYHEPTVQARQHRGNSQSIEKHRYSNTKKLHGNITTMEVGMYVLLSAFCFAIIIFVISCVVYASKFRPISIESGVDHLDLAKPKFSSSAAGKETTTNAHDWVWLGRSTMDRTSVINEAPIDNRIRITNNPFSNCTAYNNVPQSVTSFNAEISGITEPIKNNEPRCIDVNVVAKTGIEYRPPVPPHRNIGVRTKMHQPETGIHQERPPLPVAPKLNYQQHRRNRSIDPASHHLDGVQRDIQMSELRLAVSEKLPIQKEKKPKLDTKSETKTEQLSPEQVFSPREISPIGEMDTNFTAQEMHNAELLVEGVNTQQKNAFQFDTMTPNRVHSANTSENDELGECKRRHNNQAAKPTSNLLENSVGKQSPANKVNNSGSSNPRRSRIKRATVVGNPMFSNTADAEDDGTVECLGLDDLDMDYEQIMDYFDNLKESNA